MARLLSYSLVLFAVIAVSQPALSNAQFSTPEKEHSILKKDAGNWSVKGKMWMAPGSPAQEFEATESNTLIGGFWVVSKFEGTFAGMPMTGHATMGYDPKKKKYIGTWVDSMNPYMSKMEGEYDASTKTLTMMTEGVGMDGNPQLGKNVVVYNDDGTRSFTMHVKLPGASEYTKMMEMVYTKKQ